MSDEDKRKYIEEIFKYCKVDSILVIGKTGQLQRLDCPFEVVVITDVGELTKGLKCLVQAVKMDLTHAFETKFNVSCPDKINWNI
jgi:hypothetical protein